jgi:predicted NBD/HSP70 family sugar kinase
VQVRRTVRDLRRHNRSVLLSRLYLGQPQSRQDLGQSSGLSQGTVSNVVGELIEEGLVVEAGLVDSDGGRPRTLLRVNPGYRHVVGVDVGETGTRVEVFDLAMRPLATTYHPLPSARPDPGAVVAQIHEGLAEVLREADVPADDVLGVGVGVFGTVEQGPEALVHAQTIGWEAVPLERMLRTGTELPIYLENGAKTLGQAELWFGAGRGVRHAVITLVGSGVGAAVISNGVISRGVTSSAGEWGHTCIVYDGRPCRCGSRGCLEAYVGAEAVLDRWKAARGGRPVPGEDEQSSLAALLADGGKVAERVLAETAGYLGAGLANLVNLFNPERIVLAGWAGQALGARLLPQISAAAGERALRHPFGQTSIQLGRLGVDAVALGAATLPVAELLARGAAPDRAADRIDTPDRAADRLDVPGRAAARLDAPA